MIGWCDGFRIIARMSWWQVPQSTDSFGRKVVSNGEIVGPRSLPWMLWQLVQATSFSACLPDSQNASCRLAAWQARQTASFCAAVPYLTRLTGLAAAGSFRCSLASPWQAWHMLPWASFFAPCAVSRIELCCISWQLAHIGFSADPYSGFATGPAAFAGCCANAVPPRKNMRRTPSPYAATEILSRMTVPPSVLRPLLLPLARRPRATRATSKLLAQACLSFWPLAGSEHDLSQYPSIFLRLAVAEMTQVWTTIVPDRKAGGRRVN